jgi:uncharacterized RDD family membrane protein YckC
MNYTKSRWSKDPEVVSDIYVSSIQPPKHINGIPPTLSKHIEYATFSDRCKATCIDSVLISMLIIVPMMIDPSFQIWFAKNSVMFGAVLSVVTLLYFAGMESSAAQATLGKMVLGIKVTDTDGNQISFETALARNGAKNLSSILNIGYIMVAFTGRKQGLHDMLTNCLVIRDFR